MLSHNNIYFPIKNTTERVSRPKTRTILGLMRLNFLSVCIFWPTKERLARALPEDRSKLLALRAAAALLPLAYFGFGWTQVFFAHNSGNMFYIFSLAVLWGGICQLEAGSTPATQA